MGLAAKQRTGDGVSSRRFRFGGDEHWVLCFSLSPHAEPALTSAEASIAEAILEGASNRRIAFERGRSVNTVANQIAALFRKLGVRSRQELVFVLARQPLVANDASEHEGDARLRWFARAVLRCQPPTEAAAQIAALSTGAWRIVDHFDADGRRYVIARLIGSPLSTEEQVTVRRRARGDSVKEIAIDMGVSSATVSRRLTRALQRLGLARHAELPRLFAASLAA
jgi:DNA-binding NarL/FixJ family response regulator